MSERFVGRVALVTGSTRGIGLAIAMRLGMEGASVVLNGRKSDELAAAEAALREAGAENVSTVSADIADPDTARRLVGEAIERFGALHHIASSAGVSPYYGAVEGISHDAFSKMMITNTWPSVSLVQEALKVGELQGGSVVNISTVAARQVHPMAGVYGASKAALEVLTRVMARELGYRNVRVNAVAPGIIKTDFTRILRESGKEEREALLLPLQRLGVPEDVAAAACFLLSDDASWITGVTLDVDGGRLLVGDEPVDLIGVYGEHE